MDYFIEKIEGVMKNMEQFKWGDKIILKSGQTGIFEEYDVVHKDQAFVILEPDEESKGSQLVKLKDIEVIR